MRRVCLCVLLSVAALAGGVGIARATVGPVYTIKATWADTVLVPGGEGVFSLQVRNVGDQGSEEDMVLTDQLPAGVKATKIEFNEWLTIGEGDRAKRYCSNWDAGAERWVPSETVRCTIPGKDLSKLIEPMGVEFGAANPEPSGYLPVLDIDVSVPAGASGAGTNTATVSGGGAVASASDVEQVSFGSTPAGFDVRPASFLADVFSGPFVFGQPVRQAGDHPFEQRVNFDVNDRKAISRQDHEGNLNSLTEISLPNGLLRTVDVTLPRGMIGNPEVTAKCPQILFAGSGASANSTACPPNTQVGYLNISIGDPVPARNSFLSRVPIYNMVPPKGKLADFAFHAGGLVQAHIYPELDPTHDYAIKTVTPNIAEVIPIMGSEVVFWGVPGDPAHDMYRFYPAKQRNGAIAGAPFGSSTVRPLLTMPMDCGVHNNGALIQIDSYEHPEEFSPVHEATPLDVTGCEDARFRFEPEVSLIPTDMHAGAPTGIDVHLKVPQRNDETSNPEELYAQNGFVKGIATPPIKKTVVKLPVGMTISPSAGQGLTGCTPAEIGLGTNSPVRCPDSAQIGTLVLQSPDLPVNEPLEGRIYIAAENDNPFKSFFAMYLVLERAERGLLVKLPGKIELDPVTGQITTTFDDLPQFPVKDIRLHFKGGIRAALVNPIVCGRKTIVAQFYSWQAPDTPQTVRDSYQVTQNPDGTPCANQPQERAFDPQLSAGTVNAVGGSFSPFTFRITRSDQEQELSRISVTLPPGLSGRLTGVAQCPETGIARAQLPGRTGSEEIADPSCPAASQIGTTYVGAGVGASLTYVPGKVYFAGPYEGAPFSVVVITPTVVGPYDLGVVAVRSALYIDPITAQATVVTDPLPQIFQGIPVRLRDVRVTIDRPGFMFNPTDCQEQQFSSSVTSLYGAVGHPVERFQAANCSSLKFKPHFSASASGRTSRRGGASLNVRLSYPRAPWGSQANIRMVKVSLPKQLPSRLETLQKACPDSVFEANPAACPPGSRVGTASASTPILPLTLAGPAYFVSHGGAKFPELVIVLQGDGVTVQLHGETFISKAGITSSTFHTIPDVPVNTFQLTLPQGPDSALAANGNLCTHKLVMPTIFTAQNGVVVHRNTPIAATGCPRHKPHRKHRKRDMHKRSTKHRKR